MKKCFKCNQVKSLEHFYKHKKMSDGYLNKCKDCTKVDVKKRYKNVSKSVVWVEKERKRNRDKYKRLNYRNKQHELNKNKKWKNESVYKNLSRDLIKINEYELHHFSYKKENLTKVFLLKRDRHSQIHQILVFHENSLCFSYKGKLLDTKEKHEEFLISQGINIIYLEK
ncbi:MAG: hypothetical protein KGV59_06205 [Tenacibaculum sp.]|nr:hypothetical protein [Tenacibaculum sp.]